MSVEENPYHCKLYILLITVLINSCDKGFLEEVPNKSLLIPTKLEDFQAILDNSAVMYVSPGLAVISADNFLILSSDLLHLGDLQKEIYING